MIAQVIDTHIHTSGTRTRCLTEWSFHLDRDNRVRLTGVVASGEKERPLAEGATVRVTTTSPVEALCRGVARTESGSLYKLLTPLPTTNTWLEKHQLTTELLTLSDLVK